MVGAQQDERETFVVTQQHIICRAIALDQLPLEEQRFCLVVRRDDCHAACLRDHALQPLGQAGDLNVISNAVLQDARFANIKHVATRIDHPVHARLRRQCLQDVADRRDPRVEIGRITAFDSVGGGVFVEAVGGLRARHSSDLGRAPARYYQRGVTLQQPMPRWSWPALRR